MTTTMVESGTAMSMTTAIMSNTMDVTVMKAATRTNALMVMAFAMQ